MGQRKTTRGNGKVKAKKSRVKRDMWDTIKDSTGEDVIPVVKYLKDRKNISEFQIASNIKMEVNTIRNALYRLQTNNLVTYFRKKDRVKGWYISYWSFNPEGVNYVEMAMQRNKLSELRERLHKEEKHKGLFYICPGFCTRVEFEKAAELEFKCPECGKVLQEQDNSKTIETLRAKIKEVEMEA
ncbi:MAG: transcription factor [Candidatus Woesearchaeota archaeon]